jgi:peptidoglycan/xylan/chitin deacetylase (PgdA/CDA1 family)
MKKIARKSLARGLWGSGILALQQRSSRTPGTRALTYHRFGDASRDPFCVSQNIFADQMAYLADNNLSVSLADLERFLIGEEPLKEGAVLVTIDDGFRSLYSHALPVLKEYQIPAVAFITASLIGHGNRQSELHSRHIPEPYLSWHEVEKIADAGITIGSHAWTHRSLGTMTNEEIENEAMRSRDALEQRLNRPITGFAYPFGTRADFNSTTANILRRSGYTSAFTSQHGRIHAGMDAFILPRIKVEGGEGIGMFRLLVRGGLDAWCLIDRMLWRFQARNNG